MHVLSSVLAQPLFSQSSCAKVSELSEWQWGSLSQCVAICRITQEILKAHLGLENSVNADFPQGRLLPFLSNPSVNLCGWQQEKEGLFCFFFFSNSNETSWLLKRISFKAKLQLQVKQYFTPKELFCSVPQICRGSFFSQIEQVNAVLLN